jgi:hypothetical protein
MTRDDEWPENGADDNREHQEQQDQQNQSDGEGAGPAENLQEDPAYNPQGPERKYKGG